MVYPSKDKFRNILKLCVSLYMQIISLQLKCYKNL